MIVLGIDIGGSATKGALVDTETGKLVSDRIRHKSDKSKKYSIKKIFRSERNILQCTNGNKRIKEILFDKFRMSGTDENGNK